MLHLEAETTRLEVRKVCKVTSGDSTVSSVAMGLEAGSSHLSEEVGWGSYLSIVLLNISYVLYAGDWVEKLQGLLS